MQQDTFLIAFFKTIFHRGTVQGLPENHPAQKNLAELGGIKMVILRRRRRATLKNKFGLERKSSIHMSSSNLPHQCKWERNPLSVVDVVVSKSHLICSSSDVPVSTKQAN